MSNVEVSERLLELMWRRGPIEGGKLVTDSGQEVRIVYPGRRNTDRGPDFVGAIIATADGSVWRGDVELHARARDWRGHGHHRDPNYNGLILQVVWVGGEAAVLESGRRVPTLSLSSCLKCSPDAAGRWAAGPIAPAEPCHDAGRSLGDSEIGRLLDRAGEERFRLKAASFASSMRQIPQAQVLYRGIMSALGYTKNREAFEDLACRLPLAILEDSCRDRPRAEWVGILTALLLGVAGLLPTVSSGELEGISRKLSCGEGMSPSRWNLFRVRPDNHPVRRLVGGAHVLSRFIAGGLASGMLDLVARAPFAPDRLESRFTVRAADPLGDRERSLIGQGRAREIAINVVLPFAFAWAGTHSQTGLAEQALDSYRSYPRAGENAITRGLAQQLLGTGRARLVNTARREQGLIHIDKTYCRQRECVACPIARGLASGLAAS